MIIVADPDRSFRTRATRALEDRPTEELAGAGEAGDRLADHHDDVQVVVLGPNVGSDDAVALASWLQVRAPDVATVLVSDDLSADRLRAAMRAGVRDVLPEAFTPQQLAESVDTAAQLAGQLRAHVAGDGTAEVPGKHRITTVFSTKGGCGKSVVASNLAILLAKQTGEDVVLVDLDLQSGDLAIMLQLLPAWTIYDAAENLERLDDEALAGYLTPHRSGIHLLAAPLEPSLADAVTPAAVERILTLLREMYPYVIVDSPAAFTDQVLSALDVSDDILLMASMDVPSVKNLKLALQTLEQLGHARERIKLLLSRADSRVGLRLQDVEKSIGAKVDFAIPSSREVPLSINQGNPLALESSKSPVLDALQQIATTIAPTRPEARREGRRSLLRRIR